MYNDLINTQKHEIIVKYFTTEPKKVNVKSKSKRRHILKAKRKSNG